MTHIDSAMPHSAIKVANAFLALAGSARPPIPMTPLKIIKLVYIANGWAHPLLGTRLVREDAEAWTYGPVVPDLYHAVRRYRAAPIIGPIPGAEDADELTDREEQLVATVFNAYGMLSGTQLSALTHLPGTPWSITWADGAGQNTVIPDELIASHYTALEAQRLANGTAPGTSPA